MRRDVGERGLPLGRHLLALVADALRQPDEDREERERERGEPPVEQDHRDDRREHRGHVREDGRRRRRDDVLDAADVVRDPALHLARAGPREEREREPLQVPVDGGAQVVHHRLADLVREERLPDADHAGHDRDRDHPGDERDQQRHVDGRLVRRRVHLDRGVEHLAEQERRHDAEGRGDHDQPADEREAGAVAAEERDDPPEVRLPHRRIRRTDRRLAARAPEPVEATSRHESSVPEERLSRRCAPAARRLRAPARSARGTAGIVTGDGGTRIGSPITTRTCARRGSRVPGRSPSAAPTIATGTSGAPVASARRAAPRCHGRSTRPEHGALREDRRRCLPRRRRAPPRSTAATSPRPRSTLIAPSVVHDADCTARFSQSSALARYRSGRSIAAPTTNGSARESWFATTMTAPWGSRSVPSTRSRQTTRRRGGTVARRSR